MKNPATKEDVQQLVVDVIKHSLSVKSVPLDATLQRDLGATSLDLIDLLSNLEDAFRATPLTNSEEASIKCVSDLVELYWKRVGDGTATYSEHFLSRKGP